VLSVVNGVSVGVTAASGQDGLIVVQGDLDTGVYYYQQTDLTPNNVSAAELRLLAIIDNALLDSTNFTV